MECHTPFSDPSFLDQYQDSFVLVSGLGKMIEISQDYGYKKAIDIEELFALYPESCPSLQGHYFTKDEHAQKI